MPAIDNAATQPTTESPNATAEAEKKAKKPIRQVTSLIETFGIVILNFV
jgi:hypothetical protein